MGDFGEAGLHTRRLPSRYMIRICKNQQKQLPTHEAPDFSAQILGIGSRPNCRMEDGNSCLSEKAKTLKSNGRSANSSTKSAVLPVFWPEKTSVALIEDEGMSRVKPEKTCNNSGREETTAFLQLY